MAAVRLAERVLSLPEVAEGTTTTAYVSSGGEPGTDRVRAGLRERGVRVLLPVLRHDDDLDWAVDDGPLVPGRRPAIREPSGRRLGPGAVAGAAVIICPATAVALDGTRLGQGGGSYDRALGRSHGLVVALVHDDELVETLPRHPHDRPVHVAVTPHRVVRLPVTDPASPAGPAPAGPMPTPRPPRG